MFGGALLAIRLDEKMAPNAARLDIFKVELNINGNGTEFDEMVATRLENQTALPASCSQIVADDAVANETVGSHCLAWCHEALGQGSAIAYAISYWHVLSIVGSPQRDVYLSCWKAETANFAFWIMPSRWWLYIYSLAYGSISFFFFWRKWCQTPEEEKPGSPSSTEISPTGPFRDGYGDFHFCGKKVSSDREGSELNLWFTAFFILFEPFGDLLSILTVLRKGQLFVTAFMTFGVMFPILLRKYDIFQVEGAEEVARSLAQGYETKGLLKHKQFEGVESTWCTAVQVYVLLTSSLHAFDPSSLINLAFSACLSIAISIPSSNKARHVMGELDREISDDVGEENIYTFAKIENAKASFTFQQTLWAMGSSPSIGVCEMWLIKALSERGDLEQEKTYLGDDSKSVTLGDFLVTPLVDPFSSLWGDLPESIEACCMVVCLTLLRSAFLALSAIYLGLILRRLATLILGRLETRYREEAYRELGAEEADSEVSSEESSEKCGWA